MLIIQSIQGASHYTQKVTLDGVVYVLEYNWNGREGAWYLTIADATGTNLLASRKLSTNSPILARFRFVAGLPTGELIASDPSESLDYAGYTDLGPGRGVELVYFTAAEVAARGA